MNQNPYHCLSNRKNSMITAIHYQNRSMTGCSLSVDCSTGLAPVRSGLATASAGLTVGDVFPEAAVFAGAAGSFWMAGLTGEDRKSTRLNSSHVAISYAVFC